jgi:protocatechuate 3,4-dioxygenase, beta subunit
MDDTTQHWPQRRRLIGAAPAGMVAGLLGPSGMLVAPGARAQATARPATPAQSEGPFYPRELPLDRDNDLTRVTGQSARARGEITELSGVVADVSGRALANVQVEIWQVNAFGRYHHPADTRDRPLDPGFQGYGQTVTDEQGRYRFRTIQPVAYPGRAPHIHALLSGRGFRRLATQLYVAGAAENARDFLLGSISDRALRESLIVNFEPRPSTDGIATRAARFDIVLAQDGRAALFESRQRRAG